MESIETGKKHTKLWVLNLSNNPLFDLSGIENFSNLNKLVSEGIDIAEPELIVLDLLEDLKYLSITINDINI